MSIDKDRLHNICKIGKGADCCKYLGAGAKGIECLKLTPFKEMLDRKVGMVAQSDNCEGIQC